MSKARQKVIAGSVDVGDELGGAEVTGLGKKWRASSEECCEVGAAPYERPIIQYAYLDDSGLETCRGCGGFAEELESVDGFDGYDMCPSCASNLRDRMEVE